MLRRTSKRKRSKNKKGGSFFDKFKQGTADIGKGLQDARAKAGETYAGASQGMTDFNEARKSQYQSKIRLGGDAEKISLFGKKTPPPQALPKQRRPVLYSSTQDPLTLVQQANKPTGSTIIGRGGKRKTKKRRKKKKRKTKKRRRKRKTKKRRRR